MQIPLAKQTLMSAGIKSLEAAPVRCELGADQATPTSNSLLIVAVKKMTSS